MIWLFILPLVPQIVIASPDLSGRGNLNPRKIRDCFANARNDKREGQVDTLKYDDGTPEGFCIVGDYKNDKFGVQFEPPYTHYRVLAVLVFADNSIGFTGGALCRDIGGLPDTVNPLNQLDSVYSLTNEWMATPIDAEVNDILPVWFVLRMGNSIGVGGDANKPSGNSYYYSDYQNWKQATGYNWLIRLVIQKQKGYYEDFAYSSGGYTGDWEFGVPSIIEPWQDNCFGTRLHTYYPNDTCLVLESPWIKVKSYGLADPTLSFRHFYKTCLAYDGGNVKISRNLVEWELIHPFRGYDIVLSEAQGIDGELGFSGDSDGWIKDYFPIPQWDSLKIRWFFGSDTLVSEKGWFIDEIKIGERQPRDVGAVAVNLPKLAPPQTTLIPEVEVKNLGISAEGIFPVECVIESCNAVIYKDEQPIDSIPPGSTKKVTFNPWTTGPKNVYYDIKVYTALPGDYNYTNDTLKTVVLTFSIITELTSGFTETPPVIDGVIDSVEWAPATAVDGSDVLGIDAPNTPESCILYFMNSQSTLYIGCKASSLQEVRLYIDDSSDRKWATDGTEGFYWVTPENYGFQDMYYHLIYSLPDSLKSISAQGMEIAIPIGSEPYELTPGCSLTCFIYAKSPSGYIGWWPQTITEQSNPANYAQIKLIGVGVEESVKPVAADFSLRIYPNPFSKKTTIDIRLKTEDLSPKKESLVSGLWSSVSLRIYDLAGRLVHSFPINQSTNQLINYISWDANNLPSGIYFLVFKADNTKLVRKLTLLR